MMFVPRLFYVCFLAALAAQISANPITYAYDEAGELQPDDPTAYIEPANEVAEEGNNDYGTENNYDATVEPTEEVPAESTVEAPAESTDETIVDSTDGLHDEVTDATNYDTIEGTNDVAYAEPQLETRSYCLLKRLRDTTRDTATGAAARSYEQEEAGKMAISVDPNTGYDINHEAMLRAVRGARKGATAAYDVTEKAVETLQSLQDQKKQLIEDYLKPVAPTMVSNVIDKVEGGLDGTLDGMKRRLEQGRQIADAKLTDLEDRLERGESILPTAVQDGVLRVSKAIGSWMYGGANAESIEEAEQEQTDEERDESEFGRVHGLKEAEELTAAQELKAAQELEAAQRKAAEAAKEQELKQQALKAAQEAQEAKAARDAMDKAQFTISSGRGSRQGQPGQAGRRGTSRLARSFRLMS